MKYQLETIPVTDAWSTKTPCPICLLMDKAEERQVVYYLGNSVMNPETRVLVNEVGFCRRHFPMLREAGKAHHLGLIGHTHLQDVRTRISKNLLLLSKRASAKDAAGFAQRIRSIRDECLICRALERDIERYCYTAVVLHEKEGDFRSLFESAAGPCLPHAADLAEMAGKALGKKECASFLSSLSRHVDTQLEILEGEILHFTKKFDAQNDDLDWGNAKSAHARVVQALSGRTVRLED